MNNTLFILQFIFLNIFILIFYKQISNLINIYDQPDERKIHKFKTPLIGGLIIFINYILFSNLIIFDLIDFNSIELIFNSKKNYYIFFGSLTFIFFLGLIDDKIDLNSNLKLFVLTILISFFLLFDNTLLVNHLSFSFLKYDIYLGEYSFIFTVLCLLLFINACNMFDGINLQSSIYFIILILYLINLDNEYFFMIFFLIALGLIALLNSTGKIFMGDSGIYISSLSIAYFIIKIYNTSDYINVDQIFILMMVPGIDMFRLFLSRLRIKRNPFSADKNHIHHILIDKFNYLTTIIILNFLILVPIIFLFFEISNLLIISLYIFSYLIILFYLRSIKRNS